MVAHSASKLGPLLTNYVLYTSYIVQLLYPSEDIDACMGDYLTSSVKLPSNDCQGVCLHYRLRIEIFLDQNMQIYSYCSGMIKRGLHLRPKQREWEKSQSLEHMFHEFNIHKLFLIYPEQKN